MTVKPSKQTIHDKIASEVEGVDETPSKQFVKRANQSNAKVIVDSTDRRIIYKNLGPLDQMRAFKVLGDLSNNDAYCRYAMVAFAVQTIDGDLGPPPLSILSLEARVQWVGEEGYSAIWAELIRQTQVAVNGDKSPEEIAAGHSAALKKDGGSDSHADVSAEE